MISTWPEPILIALTIIVAYLLGTIPFGLLLTKAAGMGDIRKVGSGNIGATNVLRTGKKWLAALTLLLDYLKGTLAVLLAHYMCDGYMSIAGICVVLGHMFPVWLKFKGGKGVATAVGVMLGTAWPVGVSCMVTWMAVAYIFRMSSLASIAAILIAPMYTLMFYENGFLAQNAILAFLVWNKHRDNIKRLYAGEEPKINFSSKAPVIKR